MEYKNRCSSPLDMADGEILNDILGDSCTGYGESRRAANSDTGCSCNTGCSRNEQRRVTPQRDNRRSTRGERSGCSCGQSRERDETTREESGCGRGCMTDRRLESFPLAMVYSPDQEWRELYSEEEALAHGTMFKELELPFYPACRSCK